MKIKKLNLKNFTNFSDVEVVFNDSVTHLVGLNGSGKTTVGLTAIQAGLKGIAASAKDGQLVGDRYRFIGPDKKSANILITIVDEKRNNAEIIVKNNITEAGNSITLTAPEGYSLGPDWLNGLMNAAFLSAKNFASLSPKDQALALGIDVSDIDDEISLAKGEITIINRDIKSYGTITPMDATEQVSVGELVKILNEINSQNAVIKEHNNNVDKIGSQLENFRKERDELIAKLAEVESKISKGEPWLAKNPKKPTMPTESIEVQINDAEKTNRQAQEYAEYKRKNDALATLKDKLSTKKDVVEKLEEKRLDIIKSFNFGVDGLDIDNNGGLMLNDRPIRDPYFSKGEMEVIVANLYASTNPELKVRFIDDFELLDNNNADKLVKDLVDKGFQVIIANVGETRKGDNVILMKELKGGADESR